MSKENNGGPAFPHAVEKHGNTTGAGWREMHGGMTLRDYFAAKAMAALIGTGETIQIHTDKGTLLVPARKAVPTLAYEYADAMLKARQ